MRRGEAGFTIIEVIIVMAIAGALLLGAFWAMTASIEQTRFNDTMTTTQSFFQKQYLEVLTGENARDTSLSCDGSGNVTTIAPSSTIVPGGSNCILLGRMLSIQPDTDQIESRYVIGTEPATGTYYSDTDAINAYNPKVISSVADTDSKTVTMFNAPWASKLRTIRNASGSDVRYLTILRSPISERTMMYSNLTNSLNATTLNSSQLNKKVDICIDSDNGFYRRTGHLIIGSGQGQDLFTIENIGRDPCV